MLRARCLALGGRLGGGILWVGVNWGHLRSGLRRPPEWAPARPGQVNKRRSSLTGLGARAWDLSSGTSCASEGGGDEEDFTPFSPALLGLPSTFTFAFACRRPCKRRQGICSVPDAVEKQNWP